MFEPNAWGLFDTIGNAWEWVNDWHDLDSPKDTWNPVGARTGRYRVIRGGSFADGPELTLATSRNFLSPELAYSFNGFRVAWPEEHN